jgi:hypothetical protein
MALVTLPLGQMTGRMPSRFPKVREWAEVGNIAQDGGLPPALGAKGMPKLTLERVGKKHFQTIGDTRRKSGNRVRSSPQLRRGQEGLVIQL